MLPTLIKLGPVSISSYGVFMALSLVTLAFFVWRWTLDRALSEEKVFDNIILTSFMALVGARLYFALTHPDLFLPNILRLFLLWRFPGLSLFGAVIIGGLVFYLITRSQKLSLPILWDAYGNALPYVGILMSIGVFLDGQVIGNETSLFFALPSPGLSGLRHPVALYSLLLFVVYAIFLYFAKRKLFTKLSPKGLIGWMSLVFLSLLQFILALFRDDLIYWDGISLEMCISGVVAIGALIGLSIVLKLPDQAKEWYSEMRTNQSSKL